MKEKCNARIKLERAYFFLYKASQAKLDQREILAANLEATIVFARSVTFCLKKDFNDESGFDSWYTKKENVMREDPLFKFFVGKRNYILKQGSVGISKTIKLRVSEKISLSESVNVKVKKGRPWYRRKPHILWQDFKASIIEPIREWNIKRNIRRKAKTKKSPSRVNVSESFYFADSQWEDRDVFDLVREYLEKLEPIVVEAEDVFS